MLAACPSVAHAALVGDAAPRVEVLGGYAAPAAVMGPALWAPSVSASPLLASDLAAGVPSAPPVLVVSRPLAAAPVSAAPPLAPAADGLPAPAALAVAAAAEPARAAESGAALFDGAAPAASAVSLLDGHAESRAARADLVGQAQRSVYASYFELHMDAAGLSKLRLLRDAARRGVAVRLVLDSWGSKVSPAMLRHLTDAGVQVRLYHPPRLARPSWLWRRQHDKWLIVDGDKALLGDRNMTDAFFARGEESWVSREALVTGAAAASAHEHAAQVWDGTEVRAPRGLSRVTAAQAAAAGAALDALGPAAAPLDGSSRPWLARARASDAARFVHDPPDGTARTHGTAQEVLKMIREARSTIVIENAYVVLPKVFQRELARAVRRGVRVALITNSPRTNNKLSARVAYAADVPMLARLGVELWEFQGPGTLHAKAMVVDGSKVFLGSLNFDERSLKLNTESGLVDDNPALARDLLAQIAATQDRSQLVARGGLVLVRRRGAAAHPLRPVVAALRWLI